MEQENLVTPNPTTQIAQALKQENDAANQVLIRFFDSNPEFDFKTAGVETYLTTNSEALSKVSDEEKQSLIQQLNQLQRLFWLTGDTPNQYAAMRRLIDDGLDSAQAIASMTVEAFCCRYPANTGEVGNPRLVHAKAVKRAATAMALFAKYSPQCNSVEVAAIGTKGINAATTQGTSSVHITGGDSNRSLADQHGRGNDSGSGGGGPIIPDWEKLFGSLNRQQCEQSVLSPSAYLVDLLHLLSELELNPLDPDSKKSPTALATLHERRPDIAKIALNGVNAYTPLPYIDLVNEVLEGAVFPSEFKITEKVDDMIKYLEDRVISNELREEFNKNKRSLSEGAQLETLGKQFKWEITDGEYHYIISRFGEIESKWLEITVESPTQTTGTSDDLRANPERLYKDVYKELKKEIYPWTLPFDLWAEEGRVYLDHLGISRHQLMDLFTTESDNKDRIATIAAEYFGLSQTEREILSGEATFTLQAMWGFEKSDNSWIETLTKVQEFLKQAGGLNYEQLTELLATRYINPNKDIKVRFLDPTPEQRITTSRLDLTKATIEKLNEATLDRVHCFLRLQRKTKWSIREFDKALTALGYNSNDSKKFDDSLLIGARSISELQKDLSLPLEELLAWFADIDTQPAVDDGPSLYERLFQNKSLQSGEIKAFELNNERSALSSNVDIGENNSIEPNSERRTLTDANKSIICGALQIGLRDFDRLVTEALPKDTKYLDLEALSKLYRAASMSRALRLSIEDFLSLRAMTDLKPDNPVSSNSTNPTQAATHFVEAARHVESSAFNIEELDYLLRHQIRPQSSIAPDDMIISQLLGTMREGLRKIREENRLPEYADGQQLAELLRIKLGELNWDDTLVERAVTALIGDTCYEVPLDDKKPEVPGEWPSELSYDDKAKQLSYCGWMSENEKKRLEKLVKNNPLWKTAIQKLFDAPRMAIKRYFSTLDRAYEVPLDKLPAGVDINTQTVCPKRIDYDADHRSLRLRGFMTEDQKEELIKLANEDEDWRNAIEGLFKAQEQPPASGNVFLDSDKLNELTGKDSATERMRFVLNELLPHVKTLNHEIMAVRLLSEALGLQINTTYQLLFPSVANASIAVAEIFSEDRFVNSTGTLSPRDFTAQYNACRQMHKVALLVQRFKITNDELKWLFGVNVDRFPDLLDPNKLPVESDKVEVSFDDFMGLVNLMAVRDQVGAQAIDKLFELKRVVNSDKNAIRSELSKATGWAIKDIERLEEHLLADWSAKSLRHFEERLSTLKLLNINADTAETWADFEVEPEVAAAIKRTVKARYDQQRWLELAAPLRDRLREKQRDTLVAYLMAKKKLPDSYALYQHYLIDVDIGSRMMTSRTKLAISSVQLFIQRLLMNLERWRFPSKHAQSCKQRWQSLKNYRVWEANRKIFLYPENWIEPDLRKDKTELFRDLESELLQGELTTATAEQALRSYLQRLDVLSRLEVCAIAAEADTQHVFARTRSMPKTYYYRRREKDLWSSWEKLEAGVDGDHLIPVVFDNRLYLFWPEFSPQTASEIRNLKNDILKTTKNNTVQTWDYWELRLAFSQYRLGTWSPKKILDGKMPVDLPSKATMPKDGVINLAEDTKPSPLDQDSKENEVAKRPRTDLSTFTFPTEINDTSITIHCLQRELVKGTYGYAGQGEFRFATDERVDIIPGITPGNGCLATNLPLGEAFHLEGMAIVPNDVGPLVLDSVTLLPDIPKKRAQTQPESFEPRGARIICSPEAFQLDRLFGQPIIYQDDDRTFFIITPDKTSVDSSTPTKYHVENFYHPAASDFLRHLNRSGLQGLLKREEQERNRETVLFKLASEKELEKSELYKNLTSEKRKAILGDRGWPKITDSTAIEVNPEGETWKIVIDGNIECTVRKENDHELVVYQDAKQQYNYTENDQTLPNGAVDFSLSGAYSQYNWELFFHVPLLLADRLSKNQRFEDAQQWFHHIFDPTNVSAEAAPQRYWKVSKFFEEAKNDPIVELLELAFYNDEDETLIKKRDEFDHQVKYWQEAPFDPHVIAHFRISAYQKTVVMKYIDNLIAWGDQLFRQDTMESINEATQLYVLAAEILGQRPLIPDATSDMPSVNSKELLDKTKDYSDAFIEIENRLNSRKQGKSSHTGENETVPDTSLKLNYFCVPSNDKLIEYWDLVEDRLFKIRHSQNIEGIERQLALYEPPIEPGLLVRAAAAGVDISSALRDFNAPLPHYRFRVMLGKAIEYCNDVKALGASFLAALEMKDAEGLEQLRMRQISFDLQRQIGQKAIEEAKQIVADLEQAKQTKEEERDSIGENIDWFKVAIAGKGAAVPLGKLAWEPIKEIPKVKQLAARSEEKRKEEFKKKLEPQKEANDRIIDNVSPRFEPASKKAALLVSQSTYATAATTGSLPTIITGAAGVASPVSLVVAGGQQMAESSKTWAKVMEIGGLLLEVAEEAKKAYDEWRQQIKEAEDKKTNVEGEIKGLEKKIGAAKIRVELAELKKKKIEKAARDAEQIEAYMRNRFTNLELYSWRVSQLSTLYFQTYQMAFDLAKRAEKAFSYELGETNTNYIRFGYWDSLKKGLLAGEQLYLDLKRMEKVYLDQNRRCYEITKHISLENLENKLLESLKSGGKYMFQLDETLFDRDYAGHYLRRIKSVSLTVKFEDNQRPLNVNCTLTLLKNSVRLNNVTSGGYARSKNDPRFRDEIGAVQSIVTSSGKDDSGLFVLDFDDDRYLPFEGAGAISQWQIEMPGACNSALGKLEDIVLHMSYTARDGGVALKEAALNSIKL